MTKQQISDVATVTSFLAMAVKQQQMLNGHTARAAWDALMRLLKVPDDKQAEVLCRMLGDVPDD